MLLRSFFCLLIIVFTSARLDMKDCGISKNLRPRIIGGKPANAKSYPWMVFLQMDIEDVSLSYCGGTILNKYWIVTAAHCLSGFKAKHNVAYAGLRLRSKKDHKHVQKLELSKIIIHPEYDNSTVDGNFHDIALLKTKDPINIKGSAGHVNGICLPDSDSPYPTGNGTITGWGYTGWNILPDSPDALREVVVAIVPPDVCLKYTNGKIPETHVCAGGNGKNVCLGDSGGPLFQIKKGVAYLIGIVSFTQCQNASMPAVFTRVSAFLDWMEKKMT